MSKELEQLLESAKLHTFSASDKEEHRRSFAYGNTNIENSRITRQMIDREADKLTALATKAQNCDGC